MCVCAWEGERREAGARAAGQLRSTDTALLASTAPKTQRRQHQRRRLRRRPVIH